MSKSVVIYSGGMDSLTLLMEALLVRCEDVHALTFDYAQRHAKEIGYAERVCRMHHIPHQVVDMSYIGAEILRGSSQTDRNIPVPEGHYEDATMRTTVVPNRNMIMLSIAIGHAVAIGASRVYFGAHGGDHAIYPDCREEFVAAMNAVAAVANYNCVEIVAPYLNMTKGEIAMLGRDLDLNYGDSWTCYAGGQLACGRCGACQERLEAMAYAGIDDPLEYQQ